MCKPAKLYKLQTMTWWRIDDTDNTLKTCEDILCEDCAVDIVDNLLVTTSAIVPHSWQRRPRRPCCGRAAPCQRVHQCSTTHCHPCGQWRFPNGAGELKLKNLTELGVVCITCEPSWKKETGIFNEIHFLCKVHSDHSDEKIFWKIVYGNKATPFSIQTKLVGCSVAPCLHGCMNGIARSQGGHLWPWWWNSFWVAGHQTFESLPIFHPQKNFDPPEKCFFFFFFFGDLMAEKLGFGFHDL